MAPKYWANEEQRSWLHGWMPDFVRRQAEKKLHLFWPTLYAGWFERYPEHTALNLPLPNSESVRELTQNEIATLGAAIMTRKTQIESWYRYQRKKIAKGGGIVAATQMSTLLDSLFDMRTRSKGHVHQAIEIFQKRNRDAIKAALEAASYDKLDTRNDEDNWTDEADGSEAAKIKSSKSDRMRTRTQVVMALWQAALPEEKEAVYAEVEKEKEEQRAADLKEESDNAPRTPAQLQDAIDVVDTFFAKAHAAIEKSTEWVGLSMVGGCNPRLGGNLSMKIICNGATPGGNDFEDFYDEFQNVVQAFERFLQLVFSPEHCQSRALDAKAASTSDPTRPVTIIPAPIPATLSPPTEPAKKKKKKRTKTKSPAVVQEPIEGASILSASTTALPTPGVNSVQSDTRDEDLSSIVGDSADVRLDDLEASGAIPLSPTFSPWDHGNEDIGVSSLLLDDETEAAHHNNSSWPLGMTPPLSPRAAGAIAQRERGGAPGEGPAMAAIDPELIALSVSPSPTSERLMPCVPRPRHTPRTPLAPSVTAKPAGAQTTAARALSDIIGAKKFLTPTSFATHSPLPDAAARPSPPVAAAAPIRCGSAYLAAAAPARCRCSSVSPITAALRISAPPPPPIAPAHQSLIAAAAPPIAAPVTAAPTPTTADLADLELPESRPATKVPLDKTARKGRQPPPRRKSGPRKVADKEAAANQAQAVASVTAGAKKRGRPPKAAAAAGSEGEGEGDAPLDDVTNSPTAETGTIVLCMVVGNNRASARRAAQQEKAKQSKAMEDAHKAQVAKGWLPGPEGSVVILPSSAQKPTRVKKPTRNWEGVAYTIPRVNTRPRVPLLNASGKALLARAATAKTKKAEENTTGAKRKAPFAASETCSRKKQKTT
ncbi:hypothetical protein K438DRAFT_2032283 [Mycena galopus ATCC 62051]|nr:hypothetical protein K438DRAFT_2032283 [Mycena galopus ATCC 62051]